jgi:hypothetical protein
MKVTKRKLNRLKFKPLSVFMDLLKSIRPNVGDAGKENPYPNLSNHVRTAGLEYKGSLLDV